jgi:hypothetical protein
MRIFILCCGPSIKYQNLQCLSDEYCISVSNFFVHELINEIEPKYHLLPPMHPPITDEMAMEWFYQADKYLPQSTEIIFDNSNTKYWPNDSHRKTNKYLSHTILYQSVSQIALNIAISKKPTEIYLLGCDHNWIRHIGQTRHFYDESQSVMSTMGYDEWFGQEREEAKQREQQCNDNLFRIYEQYNNIAKQQNATIYNATPGSRLKAFPQKTLFEIFEEPTMENV